MDYENSKIHKLIVKLWICSKTHPIRFETDLKWNETLYKLPNIYIKEYKEHDPFVNYLRFSDITIIVPWSVESEKFLELENPSKDDYCLYNYEEPKILNLFESKYSLIVWPFVTPFKVLFYLIIY